MVDPASMMGMGGGMGMEGAPGAASGAPQDPLKFMQENAKKYIEQIKANTITTENDLLVFKKEVLTKLKENMNKFNEIDKNAAAKKAEEEAKKAEAAGEKTEEEDPFAGIFDDEEAAGAATDEFTQEKMKLATEFAEWIKIFKVQFLKDVRLKREGEADRKEEKELAGILGQLDKM